MNSFIKNAGRAVIATTLLSLSSSVFAADFLVSKAPQPIEIGGATAPAAYPENWSERTAAVRHAKLAPGQGEGRTCEPRMGDKAAAAIRVAHGQDC